MSDLDDAIKQWEALSYITKGQRLMLDAARKVANPDIEALARLLADHQGINWTDEESMVALRVVARQYVDAALGGS